MMKSNELAQKSREELTKMAADARAEIRDMRFKVAIRQYTKVRSFCYVKCDFVCVMIVFNSTKI